MDLIDLLQWPAMAITVGASWCVASKCERLRHTGFWLYLLSNALWIAWGIPSHAYALVVLQFALAAMNIRGARKTSDDGTEGKPRPAVASERAVR